jgi:hypothetical protein
MIKVSTFGPQRPLPAISVIFFILLPKGENTCLLTIRAKTGQEKTTYGGKNLQDQSKPRKQIKTPMELKHTKGH